MDTKTPSSDAEHDDPRMPAARLPLRPERDSDPAQDTESHSHFETKHISQITNCEASNSVSITRQRNIFTKKKINLITTCPDLDVEYGFPEVPHDSIFRTSNDTVRDSVPYMFPKKTDSSESKSKTKGISQASAAPPNTDTDASQHDKCPENMSNTSTMSCTEPMHRQGSPHSQQQSRPTSGDTTLLHGNHVLQQSPYHNGDVLINFQVLTGDKGDMGSLPAEFEKLQLPDKVEFTLRVPYHVTGQAMAASGTPMPTMASQLDRRGCGQGEEGDARIKDSIEVEEPEEEKEENHTPRLVIREDGEDMVASAPESQRENHQFSQTSGFKSTK